MAIGPAVAGVDFTGDFFSVDPGESLLKNLQRMMQALADEGAQVARTGLLSGSGARKLVSATQDRVAEHVIGRTVSRAGRQWVSAAVVQVSNQGMSDVDSRSLMAAGSIVARKTRTFSGLTRSVRNSRAVLAADLTAGMGG